jgi:hypothetical protein
VPERAWRYELGGYQVLKKWLGYREARRRNGQSLTLSEKDHIRSIVQRIAAVLAMSARLDEAYTDAAADSFTTADLGIAP